MEMIRNVLGAVASTMPIKDAKEGQPARRTSAAWT
jgi:hypothetical protein